MSRVVSNSSQRAGRRLTSRAVLGGLLGTLLASLLIGMPPVRATEPVFDFLRAAQDHGYGEVAIEYLEQLRAAERLPVELSTTYDLEMSRSYRAAVAEAFNAAESKSRMQKAQTHLDKFLKEHPDHPEVARAMESWGDIELDRGLERVRQAVNTRDAGRKEQYLAAARDDFAKAAPRFADATERYYQRYTQRKEEFAAEGNRRARSTATMTKKQRALREAMLDAEFAWLESRFKRAKTDFYTGQTYADPKAAPRKESLEAAAKAFDDVFQSYRESLVGLHAHLWHGRAVDEMGQDQLALDIYDEVLAIAPDGRERESGLEPLFAQAQYHRLLVLKRKEGVDRFLAEAEPWLELRRAWSRQPGYQGVMLEVAKTHLEQAKKLTGAKKRALVQSSLATLADVAKSRGEYQQEAILLRRKYSQSGTTSADPESAKTFDEALALGESAIQNLDWPGAVAMLERALELRNNATDPERAAQTEVRLDQARYQWAAQQYSEGKYDDALATSEQIMRDRPDSPMAPKAASLAISSALTIYARAKDKSAAFEKLDTLARDTIGRWPDKAEADDARIALGQASLVRGELDAAAEVFERVNDRSLRYPAAMFLAGQTNWRRFLVARSKPGADRDALAEQLAKAQQQLETSVELKRKAAEKDPAAGADLTDVQLLLAELRLAAGQPEGAQALLEPLVAEIRNAKPKPLENSHLRVLLAAARARAAQGQFDQVAEVAMLVDQLGEDQPTVNGVLTSMFQMLTGALKQAEADVIEARTSADTSQGAAAGQRVTTLSKHVVALIPPLAKRKQNTLASLIFIADTSSELKQADVARTLYQSILSRSDEDPKFKQANGPALTRIRSRLVGLLRQKGNFDEALTEVNNLIEKFPNALEPLMEKGRVLQDWADNDPQRFGEAVAHWTMLRTRLARVPRKPPEYYEIIYNAASCLFQEGFRTDNDEKLRQAEQLLNATLILSPKLSGPQQVAEYKELLGKARQLQRQPTSAATRR